MFATFRQPGFVLWLIGLGVTTQAQPHGDYLMTIPVGGGEPKTLIREPGRKCGSPRWSPDGQWVAYDTVPLWRLGVDPQLVRVVSSDGSEARTVGDGGMPSWSPDGQDLVWHTYENEAVVVGRVDGSAREEIAPHWFAPVWLRGDPRRVVTLNYGVFSIGDLKTGRADRVLAAPEGVVRGYSVSPRGDRVSYLNGLKQLCVAELKPGGTERVLLRDGISGYSSWSPEGDRLVVSWSQREAWRRQLYLLSPDDERAEPEWIRGQGSREANLNPDWSPDGRAIVYRRVYSAPSLGSTGGVR